MPQTDYAINASRGFEGQEPNSRHNGHNVGSQGELVNAHTDILPFGRFIQEGTNQGEIIPLDGAGNTVYGATVYRNVYEKDANGNAGIPVNYPATIKRSGDMFMVAEVNMTKNDPIFARHTAAGSPGAFDDIGRIRNDNDSGTALAVTQASISEDVLAGNVAVIYMNFE